MRSQQCPSNVLGINKNEHSHKGLNHMNSKCPIGVLHKVARFQHMEEELTILRLQLLSKKERAKRM
jgi:hypothetical protein